MTTYVYRRKLVQQDSKMDKTTHYEGIWDHSCWSLSGAGVAQSLVYREELWLVDLYLPKRGLIVTSGYY